MMRDLCVPKSGRSGRSSGTGVLLSIGLWVGLAAALLAGIPAVARSSAAKLDQARENFDKAREAHTALENIPSEKRTEKDYAELMEAFRKVYFTAPTYGNNTVSLMAIGELAEEAARRFSKPAYFEKAIDSYEFLLKDYPQSQFRFDALLSIARIYREDMSQPARALDQYERYLKLFPGSAQTRKVEVAIAQLHDQLGAPAAAPEAKVDTKTAAIAKPDAVKQPEVTNVDTIKVEAIRADALKSDKKSGEEAAAKPSGPVAIADVRYWKTRDYTRVVLQTDQPVKYHVGRVESPERLYLDLDGTRVTPAGGRTLTIDDDLLRSIRIAQFNSSTSRVVLDLADKTEFAISELTNPYRLVIDVHGVAMDAPVILADTPTVVAAKPSPSIPAPSGVVPNTKEVVVKDVVAKDVAGTGKSPAVKDSAIKDSTVATDTKDIAASTPADTKLPETNVAKPAAKAPEKVAAKAKPEPVKIADGSPAPSPDKSGDTALDKGPDKIKVADPIRGGAHSLTRALGLKIGRILIDPGHGGHDTGTIGPSGYTEKELVLDVSQRLGKLIEDRLGSEVAYTRDDDEFVTLENRAAMANKEQADLFISIHANSSRTKSATGIETYYLSLTADPEALEVAARENAVSQETISELQGLVRKIALSEKIDESKEFATKVQASLRKNLAKGRSARFDRGVKKAPFVVLIGANMPAILAEISFLSNPEEEKRLKTPEQRQKIAEALYAGVSSYADTLSGVKSAPTRDAKTEPTQTASLD